MKPRQRQRSSALQACANAEAAYTRTLTAASKVKLVGDCDGASVRGALDGFSDLPFMIGQVAHEPRFPLVHGSKAYSRHDRNCASLK